MKKSKTLIALTIAVAGLVATETALAQHRHHRHHHHHHGSRLSIGLAIGLPIAAYSYYRSPYYYPYYRPAPVVIQAPPTVYIEQAPQPAVQPQSNGYWYYCADARAYYPYVRECPAGWLRVAPQPG